MKYMLDTNICIYTIKKQPDKILQQFITLDPQDVCVSAVTVAELMYGVYKPRKSSSNKKTN